MRMQDYQTALSVRETHVKELRIGRIIQSLYKGYIQCFDALLKWDHPLSRYAKSSERTRTYAYQEVRNFSFSESFACLLNE